MQENTMSQTIVGRATEVELPVEGLAGIPAKVDTGADNSAIWASELQMGDDGVLSFCLFAKGSKYYTGKRHSTHIYSASAVRSAHGTLQVRYKVQMVVRLGGRRVRGTFTLTDRSRNTYPILIGCRLLNKKFLVDVSKGAVLPKRKHAFSINAELRQNPRAFFDKYHSSNPRGDVHE